MLCALGDFVMNVFEMKAAVVKDIKEIEEQYQLATYKKMPIVAERAEGVWVFTRDGDRYLDLYGGHAVAGTGHCHPHVVNAIKKQAEELLFDCVHYVRMTMPSPGN